jgi:hypothetical protein
MMAPGSCVYICSASIDGVGGHRKCRRLSVCVRERERGCVCVRAHTAGRLHVYGVVCELAVCVCVCM